MGAFIGNAARETILDHEDRLFQEAADRELVKRLNRAVAVLSDMTNDKDAITVLLQKYWEIDQCEANSLVQGEIRGDVQLVTRRTISSQRRTITRLKREDL